MASRLAVGTCVSVHSGSDSKRERERRNGTTQRSDSERERMIMMQAEASRASPVNRFTEQRCILCVWESRKGL